MARNLRDISGYITAMMIHKNERAHFELVMETSTGEHHNVLLKSESLSKIFPSEYDDKGEFLLSYRGQEAKNFIWKLAPAIILSDNKTKTKAGISKSEYIEMLAGLIAIGPNKSYQKISYITFGQVLFSRIKVFITTNLGRCISLTLDWQTLKRILKKHPSIHKQLTEDATGKCVFLYMMELLEATVEIGCRGLHIPIKRESKTDESDQTNKNVKPEKTESKEETAPQSNSDDSDLRNAIKFCEAIFEMKMRIYGYSFCFMHPETVTDQLYMKATILKKRLTDRDKGKRFGFAFFEGIRDEFAAVVNYGVIALRQGGFGVQSLVPEAPIKFYMDQMNASLSLICDKGDEYGELWRELRIGTFADMIYTKVLRLKGIEDQYRFGSMTKEGYHKFAGDQYRDLINYGLFGVVRMTEIADVMAFEMEEDETDEEE